MKNSSLLPKLLAKEDLTIKHGNYNTAWFDVKNRVLGLPLWKEMHKDVYDLFIGHEVGHALETPVSGWHGSEEKLAGCPRSYINVIEDARIERKVQSRYPGLVGPFQRGYKQLLDRDFFGPLDDVEWNEVKLIDKINLKTKLGTKLHVPFSDKEKVFLDRSLTTETFDDVLDLVRDIVAWTKENQPELMNNKNNEEKDSDSTESSQQQEFQSECGEEQDSDNKTETTSGVESNDKTDSDEKTEAGGGDDDTDNEECGDKNQGVKAAQPIHTEDDISITDTLFRENEKTLLDCDEKGNQTQFFRDISKNFRDVIVIDYPKLKAARQKIAEQESSYYNSVYTNEEFKAYVKDVKKNVQVAVKEFEMRKAAYRYTRSQTSKTGTIDVNKLWSYKTNEDIFHTATKLGDAKNHGMVLLIDLSGSMCSSMPRVMDQVMHLVMFCKAVNIPFDIYGFTSTNPDLSYKQYDYNGEDMTFEIDQLSMPHICSSSFNKADFNDSIEHIYRRIRSSPGYDSWSLCRYETYGSTPLNQALIVSHHLIKKFKQKHNIEKLNFITFTDGDANYVNSYVSRNSDPNISFDIQQYGDAILEVDGSRLKTNFRTRRATADLLDNIKTKYDTNNIGFFMANNNRDWKSRLLNIASEKNLRSGECIKNFNKEYNKNKCVHSQNILGYDNYYLVKGGNKLKTEDDGFEVQSDASNTNIRTAFKKFAKSKKQNKVLMTKFAQAVA